MNNDVYRAHRIDPAVVRCIKSNPEVDESATPRLNIAGAITGFCEFVYAEEG